MQRVLLYVFSFVFWLTILPIAVAHASFGQRGQRWLLLIAGLVVYGSIAPVLLVALTSVVTITWIAIRAAHYTDDQAMLRFVRLVVSVLAFAPLVAIRLADEVVRVVGDLASATSVTAEPWTIGALVPIGVGFYTLQAISAVHETANDRHRPGFIDHFLYVGFFPTVVVGPVQRYRDLGPQLRQRRSVGSADIDAAARLVLFGCFWKLVIADNLLPIADRSFDNPASLGAPSVLLGVVAFAFGITADLAGYSAVVAGLARLFGVHLRSLNVNRPYLARSPIEFWRRWLTSVGDWMHRYIFMALGGSTRGRLVTAMALTATFAVGTWWHGGRPPLAVWGALHLLAVLAQAMRRSRPRTPTDPHGPASSPQPSTTRARLQTVATFAFVSYTWLWFRAPSFGDAMALHARLTSVRLDPTTLAVGFDLVLFAGLLVASDHVFLRLHTVDLRALPSRWPQLPAVRGGLYGLMTACLLLFATVDLHRSVLGLL